jgi:hypothetical protein
MDALYVKGTKPVDDPVEYDRLVSLAATDPDKFTAEDLAGNPKLTLETRKELSRKKGAILSGDAREAEKSANLKRALGVSRNLLIAGGIDPNPSPDDKEGADRLNNFTALMSQRIEAFREKEKHRPSDNDMLGFAKDLLMPGRLRGTGLVWEDKGVLSDPNAYVPFEQIPNPDKVQMVAWLNANGAKVDDTTVEGLYAAWKRGDLTAADTILKAGGKVGPAVPSQASPEARAAPPPAAPATSPVSPAPAAPASGPGWRDQLHEALTFDVTPRRYPGVNLRGVLPEVNTSDPFHPHISLGLKRKPEE